MIVIYLVIIAISLYGVTFRAASADYLDKKSTLCVNGICVLLVFVRHIFGGGNGGYKGQEINSDYPMFYWIDTILGQLIVCPFLFFSGYGIFVSIKNKEGYVNKLIKMRFPRLLLYFDITVLMHLILYSFKFDANTILGSLVAWKSVGNHQWFIFATMFLYIVTYISFSIFKEDEKKAICLLIALTIVYALVICKYQRGYYYDTIICYAEGMLFAWKADALRKKIAQMNWKTWIVVLCTFVAGYLLAYCVKDDGAEYIFRVLYIVGYWLAATSFIIMLVGLMSKIRFENKILLMSIFASKVSVNSRVATAGSVIILSGCGNS